MAEVRRLAAIDIGTVTTRLLVADVSDRGVAEVARYSTITHLGDGWTGTGRLSEAAIERVASTVAEFVAEARSSGAVEVFGVATSASRDAENSADFLDRLAQTGMRPEIISGAREAELTFLGATYDLGGEDTLVVDVGGGSTELVLGDRDDDGCVEIVSARSVDVGSKRVTELYLRSDPPRERELEEAGAFVTEELRPFFEGLRARPKDMIAVAGTATSLAAIDMALDPYDPARVHGYRLGAHAIADIREDLAAMTLERRMHVVGLEPARAGVIVAGALILETALALAGLDSTLVSEHDILYGMVIDRYRSSCCVRHARE
ncbi:MAG: Ppx/GppA family phosphatase [Actinomycetia bacterium]|nr:Ppx/GppA family phosphatase [Actinomycetes bacterium]